MLPNIEPQTAARGKAMIWSDVVLTSCVGTEVWSTVSAATNGLDITQQKCKVEAKQEVKLKPACLIYPWTGHGPRKWRPSSLLEPHF